MGNATSWSIWLGVVVACFVMVGYSVRGQTRSPVLGVLVLGIELLAGWATVSALLRRNPIFFGGKKRKPGRNQRLVDPRRMALLMRNENDNPIPAFARPIRPKGHEGRSLRPF